MEVQKKTDFHIVLKFTFVFVYTKLRSISPVTYSTKTLSFNTKIKIFDEEMIYSTKTTLYFVFVLLLVSKFS